MLPAVGTGPDRLGPPDKGESDSLRPEAAVARPGFGGSELAPPPRRITGALKLKLGMPAGGWNEGGTPLGRLACVAPLGC